MHTRRRTFTSTRSVDKALRERAKKEGKSVSQVINELLRSALGLARKPHREKIKFKVTP